MVTKKEIISNATSSSSLFEKPLFSMKKNSAPKDVRHNKNTKNNNVLLNLNIIKNLL